jgi:hypothetical protein
MKFYNRKAEFKALGNIKGRFRIAVTGRRRIGKTALVEQFYKKGRITLFVSAEKAEKEIIYDWISEYPGLHLPKVDNFRDFFDFIFFHFKDKIIFIDEFQNFLKVNKSFLFDLQRLIDKYKPKLVISGSIISLMKKLVEDYKSPLYGRFDLIIKLKELDFKTVYAICSDLGLGIEDAFKLYSVFGGIPKYYEMIEKLKEFNFNSFVLDSFVIYPRPLCEEVKTMLKEEFGSEYKAFFSILSSISQGKNKHSEIAGYLGKRQTDITKYLAMLKDDFELIERRTPLVEGKKGIYAIKNNILSFWFGNIWRYNEFLETLQEDKIAEIVENKLNLHISKNFEKIILGLIREKLILHEFNFARAGSQWGKFKGEKGRNSYEIDIVALNESTKEILFAECKWQDKVDAQKMLNAVKEKSGYVEWHNEDRKEFFAVFAKSFKEKTKKKNAMLFDIKDIEKAL